jgi:SAM-dependent methyltransferase
MAAMLCGAQSYVALDVVRCASAETDRPVLDALVTLLRARAPIPGPEEFPKLEPFLPSYEFPAALLTDQILGKALEESRLRTVCDGLLRAHEGASGGPMTYHVGPLDPSILPEGAADMVFSQAVLQYVPDAATTYRTLFRWLKPGGLISHAIDFRCHGTADEWNGHWTYSDFMWRIVAGKSAYHLNRLPHSVHLNLMRQAGFVIFCDQTTNRPSSLDRARLARRFRDLSPEDLTTSTTFVQGIRPK